MVDVVKFVLLYVKAVARGGFLHFTHRIATPASAKLTKLESLSILYSYKMFKLGHRPYVVCFSKKVVVCIAVESKVLLKA